MLGYVKSSLWNLGLITLLVILTPLEKLRYHCKHLPTLICWRPLLPPKCPFGGRRDTGLWAALNGMGKLKVRSHLALNENKSKRHAGQSSWKQQFPPSSKTENSPVTSALHHSRTKNCSPCSSEGTHQPAFLDPATALRLCFLTEFSLSSYCYVSLYLNIKEITLIIALAKVLHHKEYLLNVFSFLLYKKQKAFLLIGKSQPQKTKDLTSLHICFQYLHIVYEKDSEVIKMSKLYNWEMLTGLRELKVDFNQP